MVTGEKCASQEGTRRLVVRKGMCISNGGTSVKSEVSRGTGVSVSKGRVINAGGGMCFLLGGPEKMISAMDSRGNEGAIISFVSASREVCPIKELSCSAAKLLVLAGSNSLTGGLARPGGGVVGACLTGYTKVVAGRRVSGLGGNVCVSSEGMSVVSFGIGGVSGRGGTAFVSVSVVRNEGRVMGELFRDVNLLISGLAEARCSFLSLNGLGSNRCEALSVGRMGGLCQGWGVAP